MHNPPDVGSPQRASKNVKLTVPVEQRSCGDAEQRFVTAAGSGILSTIVCWTCQSGDVQCQS
jgi:hypothetical protein